MQHQLGAAIVLIVVAPSLALGNCMVDSEYGEAVEKTTKIYFSNGILGDEQAAQVNRIKLEEAYKNALEESSSTTTVVVELSYNESHGLVDVLEVVAQKLTDMNLTEDGPNVLEIYNLIKVPMPVRRIIDTVRAMGSTPSWEITIAQLQELRRTVVEEATGILRAHVPSANTPHVEDYEADLLEGQRVIVVAHSQGNLVANETIRELTDRRPECVESLAVVGVATPVEEMRNEAGYVTAKDDRIINAFRVAAGGRVLRGNVKNDVGAGATQREVSNHVFDISYFAPALRSRTRIDALVEEVAERLPYPR